MKTRNLIPVFLSGLLTSVWEGSGGYEAWSEVPAEAGS